MITKLCIKIALWLIVESLMGVVGCDVVANYGEYLVIRAEIVRTEWS